MCVLFLSATLHVHLIHGQLLVHLYALLSCHAASVKCFYKSCFLWQIKWWWWWWYQWTKTRGTHRIIGGTWYRYHNIFEYLMFTVVVDDSRCSGSSRSSFCTRASCARSSSRESAVLNPFANNIKAASPVATVVFRLITQTSPSTLLLRPCFYG